MRVSEDKRAGLGRCATVLEVWLEGAHSFEREKKGCFLTCCAVWRLREQEENEEEDNEPVVLPANKRPAGARTTSEASISIGYRGCILRDESRFLPCRMGHKQTQAC